MAVTISAPSTSTRKVLLIIMGVLVAHVVLLLVLAMLQPAVRKLDQPKPIEVKFVQLTAPQPAALPKPKSEPKPEVKPKPAPIPKKEVPVVKTPPKPLPKLKPQPVLATPAPSAKPQAVIPPQAETPAKEVPPTPKVEAAPPAPVAPPQPAAPAQPKQVQGVAYKNPPQVPAPTDSELGGQARRVVVKVLINESGRVDSVEIMQSSGVTSLDNSVKRAVKRATFYPYRENGVAMPVYAPVTIEFSLPST